MSKNDEFIDIESTQQVRKTYASSRSSQQAPQKKKKKGIVSRVLILTLSVIMFLTGSGLVFYYKMLDTLNFQDIPTTQDPSQPQDSTVTVKTDGNTLLSSASVLNILLFGQDRRASSTEEFGRSDTTILVSIDTINKKIKLTSFQRDTYVSIPGYGDNKLNAAFSFGGVPLAIQMIEANFGIQVDKYAVVDFDSFRSIIEALGGVDIELSLDEIKYVNAQIDVNRQTGVTSFIDYDPSQETQVVHLDKYQALWYARDRGEENLGGNPEYTFDGDDWDRTTRQRKLIQTIVKSLKNASITELVAVVNSVGPLLTTNLKKSDITFLVSNMMTYLSYGMEELSIPTEGNWAYSTTSDGQSVIAIKDWDQVRYDLASFVYEDAVGARSTTAETSADSE